VKVLFICLIFRLTFAGSWSLSVCKSSNLKQRTLCREPTDPQGDEILSPSLYTPFSPGASPAPWLCLQPLAGLRIRPLLARPCQPSPRDACWSRHGSFGPSLRVSTTVRAWAVHSHVFDQQMQNLADPHHILTPVPVYPRRCLFLLPACTQWQNLGKAQPREISEANTCSSHPSSILFYQPIFPSVTSFPPSNIAGLFFLNHHKDDHATKMASALPFVILRKMYHFFGQPSPLTVLKSQC